ncbi:Cy198 [Cynomolgus cytomegalovirus]|uniref:Protein US17 n=1 Tax=Cynomolgus macaque cytomegalovirus strain Mauritius TaxID=1690255 RepID=A0A0K1GZT0_9BETA|nr:Cy198 [Cynomolgus cytomegalovirus]AKT72723.1 protein US17 [Cynomolgus macaque cytomegalovirus strain Mauritius]AXG21935.1 protein US17 [synthetic construct]APT39263.1 Cy198 [Cynomolgus cytomegalovirus]APT39550.1 Cy198 [Cynomolgus cytomegalovirus]APT39647.1 Cy198 [Cynomolgus cytomegalovirus]
MTGHQVMRLIKKTRIQNQSLKLSHRCCFFSLHLYRTVSLQVSCTFVIGGLMILAAPYVKIPESICQTGFLPALSLLIPNACLTILHAKKQHSNSWTVLTIYTLVTATAVVLANLCVDITLVTWSGLLAGILFVTCTGLACLGDLHYRRWRTLGLIFFLILTITLVALSLQPLSLPNKILLGYYVIVLAFMLGVTVFDTSQLSKVSSSQETCVLGLCLYEDLIYCYLLVLLILTTESSLERLTSWMQHFSPSSTQNETRPTVDSSATTHGFENDD